MDKAGHTWLIRHSWREEEALLGGSCCCQSALVVWKNGDHERRHVTLDLLNRQREEIREAEAKYTEIQSTELGGGRRSQPSLMYADRGPGGSGSPHAIPGRATAALNLDRLNPSKAPALIQHRLQEVKCGSGGAERERLHLLLLERRAF